MVAAPLWVASAHVRAAPLSGVVFNTPALTYDSINSGFSLPAATRPINVGAEVGATQALLQVSVVASFDKPAGALMMHPCALAPNPLTDIAVPIRPEIFVATNQVYVPLTAGTICMTTTVDTNRVVLNLLASVVPSGGAAYVDLPFQFVTTVVGPVTGQPIDFSAFGVPADASGVAVWLDAESSGNGYATVFPCGSSQPLVSNAVWMSNTPTSNLIAGVATAGAQLCLFVSDGASVDVSIDGYYRVGATPSATSPPQVGWAQESPPGFVGTSPTRLFDTRSGGVPINAGESYRLDLSPYVPIDTSSVVMNVTATESSAAGFVTTYPCEGAVPDTSSLNVVADRTVANLVTVDAGASLAVCFFASVSTHLLADLAGYYVFDSGDGFHPTSPVRMFDTRKTSKVVAGSVFEFIAIPFVAQDATALVFNLTATDVDGPGYVTAYPCGQSPPTASNLNVSRGGTVPNLVTIPVPANKAICFFTTTGTNLIADLAGWYSPSATSGLVAIEPTRWFDTRADNSPFLPAGLITEILFTPFIPDATAVVFNATATQTISPGYLTAYPCGGQPPDASNVNFVPGQTVPNMVIASIGSNGAVCMLNSERTHWIVDVSGFFTDSPQFFPFFPVGTDIS